MDCVPAPLDGSLPTLPDIADFYAQHNGDRPWLIFPSKSSPEDVETITYAEMVRASHRVAHILRPGREGPEREVIALLLNTDTVLYVAVVLGLLRAGFVPYPMSPRNSPQGVCYMLEATSCTRILGHAATSSLVYQVQSDMKSKGVDIRIDNLPGLHDVFPALDCSAQDVSDVKPYPPSKQPSDLLTPSLYIHSSGSTGFPKSVHFTYRRMLQWMANNVFGASRDVRFGAMGLPSFHAMGLLLQLTCPLARGREVVVYTPQHPSPPVIAHPQSVYEVAKLTRCTALLALPSYVEAWSHSQEIIDYLKTLRVLIYGGGPLSVSVGDKLVAAGVPLRNGYGGTEFGNPPLPWDRIPRTRDDRTPDPDWYWYCVPASANVRWEPQGDGTYELVVLETDDYHIAVYNVPGEKAYATADLFEPHPTKPDLWKIVGRKDDVITLSTGEKIVPIPQEARISASPLVAGCVMFGREREQPGVLLEPAAAHALDPGDEAALVRFRNAIWQTVEEANAEAPAFAKVFKEMILVTDPERPLPRAGKGTVIRKQALALYAHEIDKLYETIAESTNNDGIAPPASWNAGDLEPWLLDQAASLLDAGAALSPSADLFAQGFDSLSATFFRNRIIGALRSSPSPHTRNAAQHVPADLIFAHPTLHQLARALAALVDPTISATLHDPTDAVRLRVAEIQDMVEKYTANLQSCERRGAGVEGGKPAVLLTGATGNIGSHILAFLLAEHRVGRVYALNRPSSQAPLARLKDAFTERGLPAEQLDDERFVALVGDVTQEHFGLGSELYEKVLSEVTHIIHNAWTVNFSLALQSFEPQVAGVRALVDLAADISSARPAPLRLLVTSSIGIANAWDPTSGPVPEAPLPDAAVAAGLGYTASKYVVEQIISKAAENGVPATAVRMGQACGPRATGAWGTAEWMPALVKSSAALGCLPAMHGPVAWVPLDAIGQAYVDWVLSEGELPSLVNVVHPRPTTWEVVLRGVREELGGGVNIVSLGEWVAKLEARAEHASPQDLIDIPALKLLDFFRDLAHTSGETRAHAAGDAAPEGGVLNLEYETDRLLASSATMRGLQPMGEEHARMWVRYWRAKGFIA